MGSLLRIELEQIEHRIIARIDGRIDAASAPILERKIESLIAEDHDVLILDFTRVDYLSSAGMRVLLSAARKLKAKKGNLILFGLTDDVAEIIKMAGFDKILQIVSTEAQAVQLK
jgi:anti-anti-sigma factor